MSRPRDWLRVTMLLGAAIGTVAGAAAAPRIEQNKPRPHLFYTSEEIAVFRERIRTEPERTWYTREVRPDAEKALSVGICSGSDRDILHKYFERGDEIALAYLVDPEPEFRRQLLEHGTRMLLEAAEHYDAMELPTYWMLASSPSSFALSALYDSIYPELSDSTRTAIADGLLGRMLVDIPREPDFDEWANKGVISHMALGVVALALEDQAVFERAYGTIQDDEPSFTWAIERGFGEDGCWIEPTQKYHQYTSDNVHPFVLATLHATTAGVPEILATTPSLLDIYRAQVEIAFPNLLMVPTGDSRWARRVRLIHAEVLNTLYPRNDVSEYVLDLAYGPLGVPRARLNYVWELVHFGEAPRGATSYQPASGVYNDAGSGFGVLRYGDGLHQLHAFLDFAASSPNHDHRDKLSIYLAGGGRVPVTSTVGYERAGYGHTILQNTVVVDQTSQGVQAGSLESFAHTPDLSLQILAADAAATYDGVTEYERLLLMFRDEYVLDLFTIVADGMHTYDWVQHRLDEPIFRGVGAFAADSVAGITTYRAGHAHGYYHLERVASAMALEPVLTAESHSSEHGGIITRILLGPTDRIVTAQAPGPRQPADRHPIFFVRRTGRGGARFVALHTLTDGLQPSPNVVMQGVAGAGDETAAACGVMIRAEDHLDHVIVRRNAAGAGETMAGDLATDGKAALVRRGEDGVLALFLLEGSRLTWEGSPLIDTFGAIASVESEGEVVTIAGAVRAFRIHAPAATEVRLNGARVPFAQQGDEVVSVDGRSR